MAAKSCAGEKGFCTSCSIAPLCSPATIAGQVVIGREQHPAGGGTKRAGGLEQRHAAGRLQDLLGHDRGDVGVMLHPAQEFARVAGE